MKINNLNRNSKHPSWLNVNQAKMFLQENMVTALFIIISLLAWKISGLTIPFVVNDLIGRLARNSLLVLALLIPVMAGMGLNFAIVLGAMSAQFAVIAVAHWEIGGVSGVLLAVLLCTPIAILVGILTGKLLNKTRGQEMITSMIAGYFANGIYMLILLVLVGTVIPLKSPKLMLLDGVGIKSTLDLGLIRGAVDNIFRLSVPQTLVASSGIMIILAAWKFISNSKKSKELRSRNWLLLIIWGIALALLGIFIMSGNSLLNNVKVPIVTAAIIALACLFNEFLSRTKLGQDFKTVGQDQNVAKVSGINVERTRIIAITISMVLAAWGQILLLQNFGNLSTYDSHSSVGTFAIAALLIGGASVTKASVSQALMGLVLFHTLFMVSPFAGKNLLGDPQLGEFFRSFVAYGIIAVSLVMHAWRRSISARQNLKN